MASRIRRTRASVHTDQGGEFDAKLMKQMWELYKVKKSRTTPYHPEGNAQVERYNQTMAAMLCTLSDDYKDWDMKIPLARGLLARTTLARTTAYSV